MRATATVAVAFICTSTLGNAMNDTTSFATRIMNDLDYVGRQLSTHYCYDRAADALERVHEALKNPKGYFRNPTTAVLAQFTRHAERAATALQMAVDHNEIAIVAVEGLRAQIAKLAN